MDRSGDAGERGARPGGRTRGGPVSGRNEIAGRIATVLSQVLGVPAAGIGPGFSADSTPAWTSLNHLMLVSQIESEFGVFFASAEIQDLSSFDRLVSAVAGRLEAGG